MLVKCYGSAVQGIQAVTIAIEVATSSGIKLSLVGLPDNAVKESEQRIRSSFETNGYKFPRQSVIVNMAPADMRKEGSAYDLPIAVAILAASEQVPSEELGNYVMMGDRAIREHGLKVRRMRMM